MIQWLHHLFVIQWTIGVLLEALVHSALYTLSCIIIIVIIITDGKRPDGLTLVPWCTGKPLTWDVMAVSTLADSYVDLVAREAEAPAEQATVRKISKYSV